MTPIYDRTIDYLRHNQEKVQSGGEVTIPFRHIPRLMSSIPGVQRKNYTIVTANSGVGKTQFTKRTYVVEPLDFVMKNPDSGIKLHIFALLLEENDINFMTSVMSNWLYNNEMMRISPKELKSYFGAADESALTKLEDGPSKEYFEFLENHVTISTNRNPYQIYLMVEQFCLQHGEWQYKEIQVGDETKRVRDYFKWHEDDFYVILYLDNMNLLSQKDTSLWECMRLFSATYAKDLVEKYWCTVVGVQQQEASQEKKQYTYKGSAIEEKIIPTLDGLGDNKTTQRDADEIIGIFAPHRYGITEHRGYSVDILKNHYRSLVILKNRDGDSNQFIGCFYDGAVVHWEELPRASDILSLEDYSIYTDKVAPTLFTVIPNE